jgi:hypothetical protein
MRWKSSGRQFVPTVPLCTTIPPRFDRTSFRRQARYNYPGGMVKRAVSLDTERRGWDEPIEEVGKAGSGDDLAAHSSVPKSAPSTSCRKVLAAYCKRQAPPLHLIGGIQNLNV